MQSFIDQWKKIMNHTNQQSKQKVTQQIKSWNYQLGYQIQNAQLYGDQNKKQQITNLAKQIHQLLNNDKNENQIIFSFQQAKQYLINIGIKYKQFFQGEHKIQPQNINLNSQDKSLIYLGKNSKIQSQIPFNKQFNRQSIQKNQKNIIYIKQKQLKPQKKHMLYSKIKNSKKQFPKIPLNNQVYKYLSIIFDYYCKARWGKKLPQFSQIQIKNQTMTLNSFMLFCKQFQISKLPNININLIVQIFKKNSEISKEMRKDQFINSLQAFSQLSLKSEKDKYKSIFQYLSIDNLQNFVSKTKKLNINHNIKQRSESTKELSKVSKTKIQKLESYPKILLHEMKIRSSKSYRQLEIGSPDENRQSKLKKRSLVNLTRSQVFKQGYLNIHKLKKQQTKFIKSNVNPQIDMKLNNIVEEAKKTLQQKQQSHKKKVDNSKLVTINTESLKQQIQKLSKNKFYENKGEKKNSQINGMSFIILEQEQDEFLKQHMQMEQRRKTQILKYP